MERAVVTQDTGMRFAQAKIDLRSYGQLPSGWNCDDEDASDFDAEKPQPSGTIATTDQRIKGPLRRDMVLQPVNLKRLGRLAIFDHRDGGCSRMSHIRIRELADYASFFICYSYRN